jgi:hypothetical protein
MIPLLLPSLVLLSVLWPGPAQEAEPTEKELRASFKNAFTGADEGARAQAVTDFAEESRGLADSGSSKLVARTLDDALDDDSLDVRAAALSALAWGRHVETAIEALGDELKELRKLAEKLSTRPGLEERQELQRAATLYSAGCAALGRHADDRAVDALLDEVRKLRFNGATGNAYALMVRPAADGLLALGSREAVEAVVKQTATYSGSVINRGGARVTAQRLHQSLAAFSEGQGIAPPQFSDAYDQDWRKWLQEHEDEFPKKLGKLEAPIGAPEYRRPDRDPYKRKPGRAERP